MTCSRTFKPIFPRNQFSLNLAGFIIQLLVTKKKYQSKYSFRFLNFDLNLTHELEGLLGCYNLYEYIQSTVYEVHTITIKKLVLV